MACKTHKVLMLHGHGQSAEIFKPKTRYLQEIFHSLSKEVEFEFDFLSGFWPAYPDTDKFCHQRVWGYGEPEHDEIKGLQGSIKYILDTLKEKGPFSGMVGFSSGAAMTAIVTSLLEKRENFDGSPLMMSHQELRFAICLSGFKLENMCYEAFYLPKIATPTFHTIGLSDATISTVQTKKLARQCKDPWLYQYCGGHYVPQSKEFMELRGCLGAFLREVMGLSIDDQNDWIDAECITLYMNP